MKKIDIKELPNEFFNLLFNPNGRVDNIEFSMIFIFAGYVSYLGFLLFGITQSYILLFFTLLLGIYIKFVISIKRCHDLNKTGWFSLIPLFNPLVLASVKSKENDNQYGKTLNKNIQNKKHFIWFVLVLIILYILYNLIPTTSSSIDKQVEYINNDVDSVFIINEYVSIDNPDLYYNKLEGINGFDLVLTNSDEEFTLVIKSDFIGETIYNNVKSGDASSLLKSLESQVKESNIINYPQIDFSNYSSSYVNENGYDIFIIRYNSMIDQEIFYYISATIYTINYGVSINVNSNNELKAIDELENVINYLNIKANG